MIPLAIASLDPQGPDADTIADLWWLMLTLGVAVFLVVVAALAIGLFRRRDPPASQTNEHEEPSFHRWFVGGVVATVAVLTVVLGATVWALRDVETSTPSGALVVEVVGHQWWWEVRYPDEGIVTANELHIPVGRRVAVELTSADVIHSFWVPPLAGKLDALPDGTNTLVLQADEPGEHHTQCAEFCGLQHARMGLLVVAESPARFAQWVAARQPPAADPTAAVAERGRDVFLTSGCATCHTISGTPADATDGPDLTHLASRPTIGAGAAANTPEDLAQWVADPHSIKAGVDMPAADLSDDDLDALLAYLETLE